MVFIIIESLRENDVDNFEKDFQNFCYHKSPQQMVLWSHFIHNHQKIMFETQTTTQTEYI